MKKLVRFFLVFVLLFVFPVGAGLFILTRPGVQKKIIESRLPEGSSIGKVRITIGSLKLSELKLALPNGANVRLALLDTEFDPLAALLDNTIKLGALNVSGLVVDIPQSLIPGPTSINRPSRLPGLSSTDNQAPVIQAVSVDEPAPQTSGSPVDLLYAMGQFEWLLDVESINLEAELQDGLGRTYSIDMTSGAIRPGQETTIETSFQLNTREALHAELTKFAASSNLLLKQSIDGGFEQVRLKSFINAGDQYGTNLLTVRQEMDFVVKGLDERVSLELSFDADLPKPEIFLPEMAGVGPVNLQGSLVAGIAAEAFTLTETDLLLSSGGAEIVAVELKKSFILGATGNLSGNLMDIRISNLPLALLAPWVPDGLALSGKDLSGRFNLTGMKEDVLELNSVDPIEFGPITLSRDGVPLLNEITIIAQPVIRLAGDNSIQMDLNELNPKGADLLLSTGGAETLAVNLKKAIDLGAVGYLSGDLMDVRITDLPLAVLSPWAPEGFVIEGNLATADFNLNVLGEGAIQVSAKAPLQLDLFSFSRDGVPLLNELTIIAQPVLVIAPDRSIKWELGEFQMQDRYGAFLSGRSEGQFNPFTVASAFLPTGLQTETRLNFALQELSEQPLLAGYASIFSGRALLDLKLDPNAPYPLQIQGLIKGISPRAYPGQQQDYRFALQVKEPRSGVVALGANIEAGVEGRPSSNLQFAGQFRPGARPLDFTLDLSSQRLRQQDVQLLAAAFQSKDPEVRSGQLAPASARSLRPASDLVAPTPATVESGPPWASYNGQMNLKVDEVHLLSGQVIQDFVAKASVSEPLLSLSQLDGRLKGGSISGVGEARYTKNKGQAYDVKTEIVFESFDPAMFSNEGRDSFPLRGLFNGRAKFSGQGGSLNDAIEAIAGEFLLTGHEGVLTAFKLDTRSSLGLFGAGLLGKQLNRPGLTAMAQAVPYFENMPFSHFSLSLQRKPDGRMDIPELKFVGPNLMIDGNGSIAAGSFEDAMNQPLNLTLELGAKGRLVDHLETLQLLGPDTSENGFRRWARRIRIKGTLGDPDTSALERILKEAANRAFTQSPKDIEEAAGNAEGKGTPPELDLKKKPSKEERIIRDVESGLQILNSILGQ